MITKTRERNSIPFYSGDNKKEWDRWGSFFNIMSGSKAEPNIDHTPRQAVWKKNKATLWYYPAEEKKYDVPLFFVYSLINKPFILDLNPGTGSIESLTKRGYDVYLLDWGIAGYEDSQIGLDDYIVDYIQKGVKRALRHSGAEEISIIGYCLGGTLAAMYAAIAEEPIKNLIVATVPIDFSITSSPEKWDEGLKNGNFNIDRLIEVYGNMPPQFVDVMMRSITAPISVSPYMTLLSRAHDENYVEKWRRFNKWMSEHVPFTGKAFKQLLFDLGRDNKLVKGEFMIRDKKVDLSNITANLFVINSKFDQLILEDQSLPILDLVSSEDKTYKVVESGHVSLAVTGKLAVLLDEWLESRSKIVQQVQ
ncbi:alpha/beta fold hydrolase [Alkalihalobacterium alkalinitrilicum]|uniref:alpha/beta fold hydrolase n=1 Tax=Alkalihalobacterium alkalinitrilicum TaxID=427920 RepID=UPI001EE48174|nr:alpha/beta fold hydrolase [Alkalihalobacterium alkalinitrilicum]